MPVGKCIISIPLVATAINPFKDRYSVVLVCASCNVPGRIANLISFCDLDGLESTCDSEPLDLIASEEPHLPPAA